MGDVTQLLGRLRAGDSEAADALFEAVYSELRAMAGQLFRRQKADHTLQPTALVHEAYLKMASADAPWQNRAHFRCVAARAMRQIPPSSPCEMSASRSVPVT